MSSQPVLASIDIHTLWYGRLISELGQLGVQQGQRRWVMGVETGKEVSK